ncbi:zinc finger protein basonuclin-1-like [Stigmatopora nigra]
MKMAEAICCTLLNCNCENFKPSRMKQRQCENCMHGWVAHALSKLKLHHINHKSQVEMVYSDVVFDICSLMLYGTHAIPVRLKILSDRLFSVLKEDDVIKILNAFDWTLEDYIRGYVLQAVTGKVLDCWAIMTSEEEIATLHQFLRFGETKSLVELMTVHDEEGQAVLVSSKRSISDIHNFIEDNTQQHTAVSTIKTEKRNGDGHFENFINSTAFIMPLQMLSSIPTKFLGSPDHLFQQHHQIHKASCLRSENNLSQRQNDQEPNKLATENPPFSANCRTEYFSTTDNYFDVPMTSDLTKILTVDKMQNRKSGVRILLGSGSGRVLKKCRVFCNACGKTFYDKGTLKIHYNAVHLKIKHKCRIEGCNMVFSSLRSRNRHSANPNPRLHMPTNRNNRDKDIRDRMYNYECPVDKMSGFVTSIPICSAESQKSVTCSFLGMSQSGLLFPNLKTVKPVLPFYPRSVTPSELVSTSWTLPSFPRITSSPCVKPNAVPDICNANPIPPKKSRKSNLPVKIEKDGLNQVIKLKKSNCEEYICLQDRNDDKIHSAEGKKIVL